MFLKSIISSNLLFINPYVMLCSTTSEENFEEKSSSVPTYLLTLIIRHL